MSATGIFVSLKDDTITLSHGVGKKDTTHSINRLKCTVLIDGQAAKLEDLQTGDDLTIEGNPATSVSATR